MCITFAGSDSKLLGNQLQVLPIKIEEQKHHGGVRGGSFISLSLFLSLSLSGCTSLALRYKG